MDLDTLMPQRSRGFTLVELLVALSLLSVLVLLAGLLMSSARGLARTLGEPPPGQPSPLLSLQEDLLLLLRASPGENTPELLLHPVEGLRFRKIASDASGWFYAEEIHIPPLVDGQLLRISRPATEESTWVTNRIHTGLQEWRLLVVSGEALEEVWPPEDKGDAPLPRQMAAEWAEENGELKSGPLLIPSALRYKPE